MNTGNGCFGISQGVDNQYSNFYQILSSSTGKEKDSETGFYYFGARYYDPSLSGLFLSVDPMSDKYPNISPYAYCAWNPIKLVDPDGKELSEHIDSKGYVIAHYDDNDNGVYLHKVGTTKEKIDIERCMYNNTGGAGKKIGNLGDEIDMSDFFYNKLEESTSVASSISKLSYSEKLTEYAERVNQNKEWDLKNNNNTIWGVAWSYDKRNGTETIFNCEILNNANAADVGNFHAGYTGVVSGISPYVLCKGAGAAETLKTFKNHKIIEGLYRLNSLLTIFSYRSGDRKRDYYFNTKGMRCAGW